LIVKTPESTFAKGDMVNHCHTLQGCLQQEILRCRCEAIIHAIGVSGRSGPKAVSSQQRELRHAMHQPSAAYLATYWPKLAYSTALQPVQCSRWPCIKYYEFNSIMPR